MKDLKRTKTTKAKVTMVQPTKTIRLKSQLKTKRRNARRRKRQNKTNKTTLKSMITKDFIKT
jgi:hypothetical protein